jgi:hypothetical protein
MLVTWDAKEMDCAVWFFLRKFEVLSNGCLDEKKNGFYAYHEVKIDQWR